ncbi:MAG: zinc ribbon domain-containing protein [Planctomycetota bacterium]|nr:MAG: zinc ribbon domain-containing protein [Planctomycetota bacterium]
MVRGIVKSPKQSSKDDAFQSSIKQVREFVKENAFTIILAVAVIGAFITWAIWKYTEPRRAEGGWLDVDKMKDPYALLDLAEKHKGEAVEKMARKCAADRLFEEYQREQAPKGETGKRDEAEAIYNELLEQYGKDEKYAGFIFGVKDSLKKIEQERADMDAGRFPTIPDPEPAPEPDPEEAGTSESTEPGETPSGEPSESPKNCTACGTELPADSVECPSCHAPIKTVPPDAPVDK